MSAPAEAAAPRKWHQLSLTQQIMLGLVVGVLLGWWMSGMAPDRRADWDNWMALIRDIFLHLIKVMIAPLIFASVVQGFASTGDMKKARRIGVKALGSASWVAYCQSCSKASTSFNASLLTK